MLRINENLFINENSNSKYKDELDRKRVALNLERCTRIGKVFIIINIILIVIDVTVYKALRSDILSYLYRYYSHIVTVILLTLWSIVVKRFRDDNNIKRNKFLYHGFLNIIIYWCVFIALNSLKINGHIYAYIICIISFSRAIYISPLEGFITYFNSFIAMGIGIIILVSNERIVYFNIIGAAITLICSYVASNENYKYFAKEFVNNKIILNSKAELEKSNFKLREYEKLRADFFANVSHELRTPLNIIYSSEQMLELNLKNKEYDRVKMEKYSKLIKQNCFRLIRLIGNIIDITKIDNISFDIKLKNCDIISVVENVTISVADFIENKGISVIFDTTVEEKIIACDPEKIERIILNLLSNAVKFTDSNGIILVNIYLKEGYVCISVKDNGIGIEPEMRDLIFERFVQEDKTIARNKQGSGIGLSLVKSLVEMHEGTIELLSKVGIGSEFIISLPDKILEEQNQEVVSSNSMDQRIEKISIEFSDIYK